MIEILGYVSATFLAICGVPQAYHSWKLGHCDGISPFFLWSWYIGEWGILFYTLLDIGFNGPLVMNYILNIVCITVIGYYLYFPKKQ